MMNFPEESTTIDIEKDFCNHYRKKSVQCVHICRNHKCRKFPYLSRCGSLFVGTGGGDISSLTPRLPEDNNKILTVDENSPTCLKWKSVDPVVCPRKICDTDDDTFVTTEYGDELPPGLRNTVGILADVGFIAHDNGNAENVMPAEKAAKIGRLMEYGSRFSALRGGTVSGNQWDIVNVGLNSIGWGHDTVASGDNSAAFGIDTIASGINSTASGDKTIASEINSTASGDTTLASGINSTASGFRFMSGSMTLTKPVAVAA